ncbi:hypothetical protein [Acetobacter aceti]|nr:hypothetical protein [Acetobacter aceti]
MTGAERQSRMKKKLREKVKCIDVLAEILFLYDRNFSNEEIIQVINLFSTNNKNDYMNLVNEYQEKSCKTNQIALNEMSPFNSDKHALSTRSDGD